MQSKLYLLLAVLCVSVICSLSVEQKVEKSDPALDSTKKVNPQPTPNERRKEKLEALNEVNDDEDEDHSPLASYARNRFSSFNPLESGPRGRSRWSSTSQGLSQPSSFASPSAVDDFMNGGNEWSRTGFGNLFSGSSSSNSHENHPMLNNGPACHSLVDSQYPIFADICGAVPQARYSLPNSFGHHERWQVAQVLSNIIGSSEDSSCIRSLRLLLCPVLFPPCQTRNEYSTILPCQSYCRAVKAHCDLPALAFVRCETLPYSSDLCPSSQPSSSYMPSGVQSLAKTAGYQSSNYPPSRSFPSLQSLLSPQGFQSPSSPSLQAPTQSLLSTQGFPSPSSMNYYNSGPMGADNLATPHGEYPSRSFHKGYRQSARYSPSGRPSTEGRQSLDARSPYFRA